MHVCAKHSHGASRKRCVQDLLTTKLEDYASEPGKSAMDLVLFR